MGLLSSLNREQKESIGLLQIGTFLEYFDLMLYVHMAVLLNELFFPKTDPYTASLLAAFAFCSTFVFRPIGALIFGWVGDNVGRKSTIIITTAMMAISCIVMATLPTYAQIGITAAWIMTLCRVMQGISSMGEIIGAKIYVTESIQRPAAYPAVALINVASDLGAMAALGIASFITFYSMNWRYAFWVGAVIAIVGAFARTRLRETPEFLKMKRKELKQGVEAINLETDALLGTDEGARFNANWKQPVENKTLVSYFLIFCGWPVTFYLAYIYFNPLLKENFGYTPEDIILRNFLLSLITVFVSIARVYLCGKIHPVKILKVWGRLAAFMMLALPFLITIATNSSQLFLIQALLLIFPLETTPGDAVFLRHIPLYRRFTYASFLFAMARALMYVVTSFGLVYLGSYFGSFGIWFLSLPITAGYLYSIFHFEKMERRANIYPNLSRTTLAHGQT